MNTKDADILELLKSFSSKIDENSRDDEREARKAIAYIGEYMRYNDFLSRGDIKKVIESYDTLGIQKKIDEVSRKYVALYIHVKKSAFTDLFDSIDETKLNKTPKVYKSVDNNVYSIIYEFTNGDKFPSSYAFRRCIVKILKALLGFNAKDYLKIEFTITDLNTGGHESLFEFNIESIKKEIM